MLCVNNNSRRDLRYRCTNTTNGHPSDTNSINSLRQDVRCEMCIYTHTLHLQMLNKLVVPLCFCRLFSISTISKVILDNIYFWYTGIYAGVDPSKKSKNFPNNCSLNMYSTPKRSDADVNRSMHTAHLSAQCTNISCVQRVLFHEINWLQI